jgi:hypothetical protein
VADSRHGYLIGSAILNDRHGAGVSSGKACCLIKTGSAVGLAYVDIRILTAPRFGDASILTESIFNAYALVSDSRAQPLLRSASRVAYNGGHLATLKVQRCG